MLCNTPDEISPVRVRIIVIASAIIELTWLKEERRKKIDDLAV